MSLMQTFRNAVRRLRYPGSRMYWERRYASGGNSGPGSTGVLAAYKAAVVNALVAEHGIRSVVELGCGDGQQLMLAVYPEYAGVDISASAIDRCRRLFANDPGKKFDVYDPGGFRPEAHRAELALSMEVIFHLTEDALYRTYLEHLFACAERWVIIFSSNNPEADDGRFPHVRSRAFLPDVPAGWKLEQRLPNPHAAISMSEFFIFSRT